MEMENTKRQAEQFQDELIIFTEDVSDAAYEKFVSGNVSQKELQEVYMLLRQWISIGEKILQKTY
jgi:hypothetical protein